MKCKHLRTLGCLLALLILGFFSWRNRRLVLVKSVTSGESADYPVLHSHVYYAEPSRALHAAEQAIHILPRWRLVCFDLSNNALDAEVSSFLGSRKEDLTLYAEALGRGQCRVIIHSRSQCGKGDFGRNAAHIRILQAAMDTRLTQDAAI